MRGRAERDGTGIPFGICSMRFGDEPGLDDTAAELRWQEICPHVRFEIIPVPRKISAAHDIANWCISKSGSTLKTAIECAVPMKPFIDAVLERGYRTLLQGMSGGLLWGVGRQAMMQLHRVSHEKGDAAGLRTGRTSSAAGSSTSAPASRRTRPASAAGTRTRRAGSGTTRSPSSST